MSPVLLAFAEEDLVCLFFSLRQADKSLSALLSLPHKILKAIVLVPQYLGVCQEKCG